VVLRYFACVGRAQPLRHALSDSAVPFSEVRVEREPWSENRDDPGYGGMFRSLPTLTWGNQTLSETLPIASFIAKKLGHYDGLYDFAIAQLEAVSSNCYLEGLVRVYDIITLESVYPGADLQRILPRMIMGLLDKLDPVDDVVPEMGWLGGERPALADYFAAEAYEAKRYLLGPARERWLKARLPSLAGLAERIKQRPAIAEAWKQRPATFTSNPNERAIIEKIRAVDLSSIGLRSQ
jgi:glutathione S-transferase